MSAELTSAQIGQRRNAASFRVSLPAGGKGASDGSRSLAGIGGIGESRFLQTTNRALLQCTRHQRFPDRGQRLSDAAPATEAAPRPPWHSHNALIWINLTLRARHVRKPRAATGRTRMIRVRIGAACEGRLFAVGQGNIIMANVDGRRRMRPLAVAGAACLAVVAAFGSQILIGQALAQGAVKSVHGDWQIRCDTPPGAQGEQCALMQSVTAEDRPNVGLTVIVLKT